MDAISLLDCNVVREPFLAFEKQIVLMQDFFGSGDCQSAGRGFFTPKHVALLKTVFLCLTKDVALLKTVFLFNKRYGVCLKWHFSV